MNRSPNKSTTDDVYKVDKIVGRRQRKGKVEYRVRWKGYPPSEDSWEPYVNLKEACPLLIEQFIEHRKKQGKNLLRSVSDCELSLASRGTSPNRKIVRASASASVTSISPSTALTSNISTPNSKPTCSPPQLHSSNSKEKLTTSPVSSKLSTSPSNSKPIIRNSAPSSGPIPIQRKKVAPPPQRKSSSATKKTVTIKFKTSPTQDIKKTSTLGAENLVNRKQKISNSSSPIPNKVAKRTKTLSESDKTNSKSLTVLPKSDSAVKKESSITTNNLQTKVKPISQKQNSVKPIASAPAKNTQSKNPDQSKSSPKNLVDSTKNSPIKNFDNSLLNDLHTQKRTVLTAINYLKRQKRRPDSKNIVSILRKHHSLDEKDSRQLIDHCIKLSCIERVEFKNASSYRIISQQPLSTKIANKYLHRATPGDKKANPKKPTNTKLYQKGKLFDKTNQSEKDSIDSVGTKRVNKKLGDFERLTVDDGMNHATVLEKNRQLFNDLPRIVASETRHGRIVPPVSPVKTVSLETSITKLPYQRRPELPHTLSMPNMDFVGSCMSGAGPDGSSSVTGSSEGANSGESSDQLGVRRTSVRQTESTYKYKEIIVKRNQQAGFTELWIHSASDQLKNPMSIRVLEELKSALDSVTVDDNCRLVMLSGMGSVFSGGIDLQELSQATCRDTPARVAECLRAFLLTLIKFSKPVVAAVNGPALGLAVTILPLCDLIYATDKATFHLPYTRLGQIPEGGASYTLGALIGVPAANELLLAGRKMTAREALQRGLISDVLFPKNFKQEILKRCQKLAACSSLSLQLTKCILRHQHKDRIETVVKLECKQLVDIWYTAEYRRNIDEFLSNEIDLVL